jgi:hypothetical protein
VVKHKSFVLVLVAGFGAKAMWYRNDNLTIFDPPHMVHASLPVPGSIDAMVAQVAKNERLSLPLSDLVLSDPCAKIQSADVFGGYVGVNDVNGVPCDHIAFSSAQADLQLWLTRTEKPLPLKFVINYRTEPASPQYISVLSNWKFPKEIPSSVFKPVISKNAKEIGFLKVKE